MNRGCLDDRSRILQSVLAHVRLFHPFPVALVVATSAFLVLAATGGHAGGSFLARVVAVILFSQIAVGALNDYWDRGADDVGQPYKPIPSGLVKPGHALSMAVVSFLAMLPVAASFGLAPLVLALFGTAAGIAYDIWLKPTSVSALAYIVGFLTLLTWIWIVAGSWRPADLLVYPAASFLLVAAHLAQSFPDIEADGRAHQHGMAVALGEIWTFRLIVILPVLVAAGGIVIGLAAHSAVGSALVATSLCSPVVLARLRSSRSDDRCTRRLMFLVSAPGVAALGLGCMVSLSAL